MELPLDQILLGDCLELLKTLPDDSIDAVVSDPPYGLGNKDPSPEDILAYLGGASSLGALKKGRRHCLNSILRYSVVSDAQGGDPATTENLVTFKVTLSLNGVMPSRVVELDHEGVIREHEVDDKGPIVQLDNVLMNEVDALVREGGCDGLLRLRERKGFSGCVQTCSCFTQLGDSLFRVAVRLSDDSFGESKTAASILTSRATETRAVLTLDLAGGTGELTSASGADDSNAGLLLASTEDVGTLEGTSRLLSALQALLTGQIRSIANGTLTFEVAVPSALLRRIHEPRIPQRDFMNRSWELPSVAVWREVYRVLKPGGYVASFSGTRTFDLMSIGLRMAGFECRDTISRFHPDAELPVLQWVQGCLTPDVEVLTPLGWRTYESLSTDGDLLVFDPSNVAFSWARPSQVISYQHEGPMVRVQTALGSYDVTPDHTVYQLAEGRWLPARAATLDAAEVPSVQDLSGLLDELHRQRRQAGSEEGLLKAVHPGVDCASADGSQGPSHLSRQDPSSVPPVQEALLHASSVAAEGEAPPLLPVLQRSFKEQLYCQPGAQGTWGVDSPIPEGLRCKDDGAKQSIVGGRSDLPPIARELRPCEVCEVPIGVHADGSEGRLRVRAPVAGGSASRSTPLENGGRSSRGPRLQEQFSPEPDALPQSERAQAVRGARFTRADLAGFTSTTYQGFVWCVTVPTGAFVARRNGYVFITGNSGMPKSHSIGKAIDKKLGKKREVTGHRQDGRYAYGFSERAKRAQGKSAHEYSSGWVGDPSEITEPASPEAAQWEGWGSALKPSWEPILLFRKPLEGTLADNVLEHGTGGLNIDATRVRHASKADFEAHKAQVDSIKERGGSRDKSWKNSSDLSGANEVKEGGRWPANALFSHAPGCRKVGTERVRTSVLKSGSGRSRENYESGVYGSGWKGQPEGERLDHADEDGKQEVDAWECVEGCPARELNEQSGDRPSTLTGRADPNASHKHPGTEMNPNSAFLGERTHLSRVYADGGGAARFFTQFEGEAPGAWECVDGCPVKALDGQSGTLKSGKDVNPTEGPVSGFFGQTMPYYSKEANYGDEGGASRFFSQFDGVPFRYVPKANRKEAGCGEFEVQHITVKPLSLMRWIVKLVTRKGGVVLDPYSGSGSTLHAAVLEGMHFIGIERDPTNHAEALRRLEIVLRKEEERKEAEALHEFAMGRS